MVDEKRPRLTNAFIKSIDRPTRRGDGLGGNGLSIMAYTVAGGLNKAWSQRILVDGKERTFGLGKWPQITIATARKRAFQNVSKRDNGKNIREPEHHIPTMGEAFDQFIADHTPEWKRRGERRAEGLKYKWELSKRYCSKSFLSKKISAVTHDDVKDLLRHDWHEHAAKAAYVQTHLSQIFKQAVDMEIRTSNPANREYLVGAFGKQPKGKHHPSAPYEDLGGYLGKIMDSKFWWAAKYCLVFIALTEDRSGEVREAVWDDVDWDEETLTIPVERMKGDKEHVIPLCTQAMDLLRFAWSKPRHSQGTIFPPKQGGIFLPKGAMRDITKKLGLPFVPHGLRGSFGNWALKHTNPEYKMLAKLSLAHVVDNKSDEPYFTEDPIDKRRAMLQAYSEYLTKTSGLLIAGAPRPKIKSKKDKPATGAEPHIVAAVSSKPKAGKAGSRPTAASTTGKTPKRSTKASKSAPVDRPPKIFQLDMFRET